MRLGPLFLKQAVSVIRVIAKWNPGTPSMIYLRMQPARKWLAARRAAAGLAVASSREHTNSRRFRRQRR